MSGEMSGGSVGFRACVASCKNSMRRTTKSAVFFFGVHGDRSAQTTQSVANKHIASKQRNRVVNFDEETIFCVILLLRRVLSMF